MKWMLLTTVVALVSLAGCSFEEIEHEIGYKGRARVNPWLAAERFVERRDYEVRSLPMWEEPDDADSMWFVPAFLLSNESFTRRLEDWVIDGGHAVILVEHADSQTGDWSEHALETAVSPALQGMLKRAGIVLEDGTKQREPFEAGEIIYQDTAYEVEAASTSLVSAGDGEPGVFASVGHGDGMLVVLTDSRIFRNRWIGEKEHAELLDALIDGSPGYTIVFLRGSGLSLWALLGQHLWPVLVAIGVLLVLWLWKNLARFGPFDTAADPAAAAGYEHHLEALGDFQWRLDRGKTLLVPLREQLTELGQHLAARTGHRDADFFQFLADRAQLPRERVFRALAEVAPADPAILTRTTADLQRLSQVLNHTP